MSDIGCLMHDLSAMDDRRLRRLRQTLHAYPETSNNELETAQYLKAFINETGPDRVIDLADYAFAVVYQGHYEGPTVMIRADMDALPIAEINDHLDYKSNYDGVSHACGHDGHMAIVAGLGAALGRQRPESGRVILFFQQAEETGNGARDASRDSSFAEIEPDYVFALHNIPGYAQGEIVCGSGIFSSAVVSMIVRLYGKEAHSAQPETGINPAAAIAEIVQKARALDAAYDVRMDLGMIVPIHIQMGEPAQGVSAGQGEIHFTLRALNNADMAVIWNELEKEVRDIADAHELACEFDWYEDFAATYNDDTAAQMVRDAAEKRDAAYREIDFPFSWGEDFGVLTRAYRGAMFGLGAGMDKPDLHNPDYDFPDDIIMDGVEMFRALIGLALSEYGHNSYAVQKG